MLVLVALLAFIYIPSDATPTNARAWGEEAALLLTRGSSPTGKTFPELIAAVNELKDFPYVNFDRFITGLYDGLVPAEREVATKGIVDALDFDDFVTRSLVIAFVRSLESQTLPLALGLLKVLPRRNVSLLYGLLPLLDAYVTDDVRLSEAQGRDPVVTADARERLENYFARKGEGFESFRAQQMVSRLRGCNFFLYSEVIARDYP